MEWLEVQQNIKFNVFSSTKQSYLVGYFYFEGKMFVSVLLLAVASRLMPSFPS